MSDYKTANLKPETMERLREYAVGDESVDSAVQRLLDSKDSADVDDLRAVTATPEDLTALRSDVLERIEEVADTLESVQGDWEYLNGEEIHGAVHESEHSMREVIGRLDDLESQLPRKVAQELGQ